LAFYHAKRPFLAILSDSGLFSHLWLFIMNGRLFSMKKRLFSHFIRFRCFSSNFSYWRLRNMKKRPFLAILADSGVFHQILVIGGFVK